MPEDDQERLDLISMVGKQEGKRIHANAHADIEQTVSRMLQYGGGAITFTNTTEILAFVSALQTEFQRLVAH